MDVYILPKHIWGKYDADERDEVRRRRRRRLRARSRSSEFKKGQFARFKANPNYWGGKPAVDKVVLRKFNNPDAMVAALEDRRARRRRGHPERALQRAREGRQHRRRSRATRARMDEIAINGGDGLKKPHPALLDPKVREAIGHAIDRETIVDRVLERARHSRARRSAPRPTRSGRPTSRDGELPEFDLDRANAILDEAGYEDTDGDGVREMPGGGQPLNFKLHGALRQRERASRSPSSSPAGSKEIGIGDDAQGRRRQPAHGRSSARATTTCSSGAGRRSSTPTRCSSYFTCDQVASDPDNPTDYYNDANYCDPEYDKLYEQQKVELDDQKRLEIVHEMLKRQASWGVYNTLYTEPDLAGVREGPLHGLGAAAGRDRPGALLEHLADLRAPEAGVGDGQRRR